MLALKSKGTNSLLASEKQSLIRFLVLYIMMVFGLIIIASSYYYQTQMHLMLLDKRETLSKYAYEHTKNIKLMHHDFPTNKIYPRYSKFKSAIYDTDYNEIFSLLQNKDIRFNQEIYISEKYIHFVKLLDNFYLGANYIIIEIEDDGLWRTIIWQHIIGYGILAFILFIFFGIYLAKLFLKPMRDSLVLLDKFIKDTTHELNTPLTAILSNIEMMDTNLMAKTNIIKLNRINIAAKTVTNLYKDLTYLILEKEKENDNVHVNIKLLLEDRIEYFMILAESKKLIYKTNLRPAMIFIDKRKLTRVIDNLISNAIKYNKRDGVIGLTLRQGELIVWDTGLGIDKNKIELIFDRYSRFNKTVGGFGVGLSIVRQIIDEYELKIEVISKVNIGTRISLKW